MCGSPDVDTRECPGCGLAIDRHRAYFQGLMSTLTAEPPPSWRVESAASAVPAVSSPAPVVAPPASFWSRAAALVIDYAAVHGARVAFRVLARAVLGEGVESTRVFGATAGAFPALFGSAYAILAHFFWGQTLGKAIMGIRVRTREGGPLSLGTAVLRQIGFAISVLTAGLGFLFAAVRRDRRALHDLVARTSVVRVEDA
ncbi:MAG TPA: RDD family protein [Candidatus Limnocylindrales bacterium]|nr:RDD family protein [Candidatus Limnocylindrales bacterium]